MTGEECCRSRLSITAIGLGLLAGVIAASCCQLPLLRAVIVGLGIAHLTNGRA